MKLYYICLMHHTTYIAVAYVTLFHADEKFTIIKIETSILEFCLY